MLYNSLRCDNLKYSLLLRLIVILIFEFWSFIMVCTLEIFSF